jgi:proteasome lid subunit RPN8/RPN11
MTVVHCPPVVVDQTVASLRADGMHGCESVMLWLGKRVGDHIAVTEALRPEHHASSHRFWIPEDAMDALRSYLRQDRIMIAAQVHSHPADAFHSEADDAWAIIRHEGALSLVVPDFVAHTTAARFLETAKVFRHTKTNEWLEVPPKEVADWLIIC